ncbi:hypothetical protein [Microbacterium sp. KR10-403]|uniref:hypothetical protein n=1 Tax=Microbacterium sp. KR10-403 TaxID=3158581 RepID=UPI0032E51175
MIGGRNGWIAWPVGIVCVGVVGALVWLAVPGVPTAVQFAGDVLRSGTRQLEAASASPEPVVTIAAGDDCRDLYPSDLWMELTWSPDHVLNQSQDAPATSAAAVRDALSPQVLMTCAWRTDDGQTLTTTLSRVDAAAAAIARDAFTGAGFACAPLGAGVRCTRTVDGVGEDDIVDGDLWLVTTEDGWRPEDYTDRLAQHLWPR